MLRPCGLQKRCMVSPGLAGEEMLSPQFQAEKLWLDGTAWQGKGQTEGSLDLVFTPTLLTTTPCLLKISIIKEMTSQA